MSPGHLIFVIDEVPHILFKRQGNDLHSILKISLKEALLGFEKEFIHLDGHQVKVSRSVVSQPGDVIKVEGEGMPYHQSSGNGDLLITLEIVFPDKLTEEQKKRKIN